MMECRELTRSERTAVLHALLEVEVANPDVCRRAVDECRLFPRLPSILEVRGAKSAVAHAALRTRACGITLGSDVFVRSEYFDDDLELPLQLVAHEVAHVAQFRRDGVGPFLGRYLWDYLQGLASGLRERQAYLSISYEREARRVAEAALTTAEWPSTISDHAFE